MTTKVKILCWADSAASATGFGVVSKHILGYLYSTGKYDIDHLAINYPLSFGNISSVPWTQIPARLTDGDPYGKKLFLKFIAEGNYDAIWILNDTHVTYDIAEPLRDVLKQKGQHGAKIPKIFYYYPVDCHIQKEISGMLEVANVIATYTDYGVQETLKTYPHLANKIHKIGHGTNTNIYKPLGRETQQPLKQKYLGRNAHKYAFLNVNRNSDRKQLSRTILAFSKFKQEVPNSILLLHTMPIDKNLSRVIDLFVCVHELGLSLEDDVLFPKYYNPSRGFPEHILNELYNMADCFISNHLGEGWGLSLSESMSAGTPIVCPRNTCMSELFGENSERGYLYRCSDFTYIDNAGFRPFGTLDEIVNKMHVAYRAGNKYDNPKVKLAREWAEKHTWDDAAKEWEALINRNMSNQYSTEVESLDDISIDGELL